MHMWVLLTNSLLLFLRHIQCTSDAVSYTHPLTERAQLRVILLILPDIQKWLAVL